MLKEILEKQVVVAKAMAGPTDHIYLFSTITILSIQREKGNVVAEQERMRLTAVPMRYSYSQSRNLDV